MPVRPAPLVRLAAPLTAALTAALLLTGCSGGGSAASADLVKAAALPAGSCRQAAAPLNEVHRRVADLRHDSSSGSAGSTAAAARAPLAGATRDLQAAAATGTGGTVPARLSELVQAVGFLRLGIDTHSYDAALLTRTDDAAAQLVKACGAG